MLICFCLIICSSYSIQFTVLFLRAMQTFLLDSQFICFIVMFSAGKNRFGVFVYTFARQCIAKDVWHYKIAMNILFYFGIFDKRTTMQTMHVNCMIACRVFFLSFFIHIARFVWVVVFKTATKCRNKTTSNRTNEEIALWKWLQFMLPESNTHANTHSHSASASTCSHASDISILFKRCLFSCWFWSVLFF